MGGNAKRAAVWALCCLAVTAGTLLAGLVVGEGSAAAVPVPYARLAFPSNDGGIIICRPPVNGATAIVTGNPADGGFWDIRSVFIQVREGAAAPVRIGPSSVNGTSARKNGTQMKARETLPWDVSRGSTPYCVVEDSDAGVILDVTYGLGK